MRLSWNGTGRIIVGAMVVEWQRIDTASFYQIYSLNKRPDQNPILEIRVPDYLWQDGKASFYDNVQR
jgi:hypothetical protein